MQDVARILIRYGLGALVSNLDIPGLGRSRSKAFESNPQRVLAAIQELGPTFIKFGQILSTRVDVIPKEYTDQLEHLQDDVDPLPFPVIDNAIAKELGEDWRSRLASFSDEPIAAASMAQVHRATLKGGRDVVFKIRRPGILKLVKADLSILRFLVRRMLVEFPNTVYFDPEGVLQEFERAISAEMDFSVEAANIRQFLLNFGSDPVVRIPEVINEFSTNAVLCMTYLDGVRIREAREAGFDMERVGENYLDVNYKMLLQHGFFHSDLHPGNVLVLPGEVIGLLDFGMTGRLTRDMQDSMVSLIFALERGDFRTIARVFYDNAIKETRVDYPAFERDVVELVYKHWRGSVRDLQVGLFLTDLATGAIQHRLRTPQSFTMFFKALLTTEGLAKSLVPEVEPLEQARPYVEQMVARRYAPQRIKEDFFYNMVTLASLMDRLPITISQFLDDLDKQRLHLNLTSSEDESTRIANHQRQTLLVHGILASTGMICGTACLFTNGPIVWDYPLLPSLFYIGSAPFLLSTLWRALRSP